VVSVSPSSLSEVWASIGEVASALGAADRGRALVDGLTGRITAVGEKSGGLAARPRVACVEWLDPLMAAGNWVPELVALAGGHGLFGTAGEHSPWLEWDLLREADPEVIVVMPCGFDRVRTRAELGRLTALPDFAGLDAARGGRIFVVDGNQYFNRPGPRLVESLEILAEILHPEIFSFGHEGRGWERVRI
jgi:iron complex transport system substrate-binding protein